MSTQIVPTPNMTMIIKLLSDHTVKRLAGIDNVPHLCVKVRHGDGYSWFGINVLNIMDDSPWTAAIAKAVETSFMEAMGRIVDLKEMITDVPRLMDSIQDITTGRRRPIMFGGNSNERMQITGRNNIQIEVYRETVKKESLSYGGHMFEMSVDGLYGEEKYAVYAYHRGVILYNYADEQEVGKFVRDEITSAFPEIEMGDRISLEYISQIDRNRSKTK